MLQRLCLAFGLALSCCAVGAKPIQVPMPVARELPVELVLNQQEMAVEVPQTATAVGMQFGLIGAIIGSAVQNAQAKKAETRVVPVRDLLVRYRFNERLEAALREKLASEGLSPHPQLSVRQTAWDQAQANDHPASMQALVIVPRYAMTYDFQTLSVNLATSYVERTPKSNGKYKTRALFSRSYKFEFPLTAPPMPDEDMVQRWVGLGSDGLSQLLDQGIAQTTDMLVHDFSAAGRAQWEQTGKGQYAQIAGQRFPGAETRKGNGWVWVRSGKGTAQRLTGHQPLDATALAALARPVPALVAAPSAGTATGMPTNTQAQTPSAALAAALAPLPGEAPVVAATPANAAPASAPTASTAATAAATPPEAPTVAPAAEAPIAAPAATPPEAPIATPAAGGG